MRTQSEVVAKIRATRNDDVFGFVAEVLLGYLDFDNAKEFLKPEASPEKWAEVADLSDRDKILASMRDYMAFAWDKADDHRGLSAGRSVQKLSAWAWLLGDDEAEAFANSDANYAQYGAPVLKYLSERFGFPIPDSEALRRMAEGMACVRGCKNGCAR